MFLAGCPSAELATHAVKGGMVDDDDSMAWRRAPLLSHGTRYTQKQVPVKPVYSAGTTPVPARQFTRMTNRTQAQGASVVEGKEHIQVGAFARQRTAQRVATILRTQQQYPVYIQSTAKLTRPLYRVRVNPLNTSNTRHALASIKSLGYTDASIVISAGSP